MDVIAGAVVFVLLWRLVWLRFVQAFHLGAMPNPPPSAGDIAEYWITAGVTFAILIFGFVIANAQSRPPAIVAYLLVSIAAVLIALVFSVPSIDWNPDPVHHVNPNYCSRTDSENCPGG